MKKSLSKTILNNKINFLLEKKLGVIHFYDWLAQNYSHQWDQYIPKEFLPFIKEWFETHQGQTPPPDWYDMIPDREIWVPQENPQHNNPNELPIGPWDFVGPSRLPFLPDLFLPGTPPMYPENSPDYQFGGTVHYDLPGGGANDGTK